MSQLFFILEEATKDDDVSVFILTISSLSPYISILAPLSAKDVHLTNASGNVSMDGSAVFL